MEWEEKLKDYCDEQGKLWEQYKGEVGKEIKAIKDSITDIKPETKEKIDKMEADFGGLETKIAEARNEIAKEAKAKADTDEQKFKDLEAKFNRPRGGREARLERKDFFVPELYKMATEDKAQEKADATWKALSSPASLTSEEKALTIGDPETGGYLATPEVLNTIIKELREITPAMQIANVRTTSNQSIVIPKKTGTIAAVRRGESETKTKTEGLKYGTEQLILPELYAFLDVTEMDLEDTMFNLEGEIREEFVDAFNAKLGDEFINGSGPLQLEGLLTNADIGSTNSGSNSVLQPDQLITFIEAALKQQHKVRAQLMFNQNTLAAIRILQVPTVGGYIWTPGFGPTPNTIMGKPYIISEDMPDIAQNAYPIIYGDYKKGYQIGLRIRMGIKRITDSVLDEAGTVRFSGRMRVGGKTVLATAIKKHKIST